MTTHKPSRPKSGSAKTARRASNVQHYRSAEKAILPTELPKVPKPKK